MRKMAEKDIKYKDLYFFFKYLWIFILVPKILQLAFIFLLLIYYCFFKNYSFKISNSIKFFLLCTVVHSLSIFINALSGMYATDRIFAAINTNLIWYLALLMYCILYNYRGKLDLSKLGRYSLINLAILLGIFIISYVLGLTNIKILGDVRDFFAMDFVNNVETTRFCGLFEYSTLVGYFTCLCLPSAIYFLVKSDKKFISIILLVVSFIPIWKSNSRMAMVFVLVEIVACMFFIFINLKISRSYKQIVIFLVAVVVILFVIFKYDYIYSKFEELFLMRKGSNSTRMDIYKTSINKALSESPFIGIGIKEMYGDYPLGSHSTYIGMFYKTGIFGSIFFLTGVILFIAEQWRYARKSRSSFDWLSFACTLVFFVMLATEDLDGVNWLIMLFFGFRAIYCNAAANKKEPISELLRGDYVNDGKSVCSNT